MPTVIYIGKQKAGRNMGALGYWRWGAPVDKSQEWVDANSKALDGQFKVDGKVYQLPALKQDKGNDGIPDAKWTKGDIMTWLDDEGVDYSSLNTKAKLLAKVKEHLNPSEETITKGEEAQTTGSDE